MREERLQESLARQFAVTRIHCYLKYGSQKQLLRRMAQRVCCHKILHQKGTMRLFVAKGGLVMSGHAQVCTSVHTHLIQTHQLSQQTSSPNQALLLLIPICHKCIIVNNVVKRTIYLRTHVVFTQVLTNYENDREWDSLIHHLCMRRLGYRAVSQYA